MPLPDLATAGFDEVVASEAIKMIKKPTSQGTSGPF